MQQNLAKAKAAAVEYMAGAHPDRTWFIVGGALRDTDAGIAFKDVDIFVSGYAHDPEPTGCNDDGERDAYLMRAYTVEWKSYELNIIFLRGEWDLERATNRCDFGICQIGYDPTTRYTYRSDAYRKDRDLKTLTLTRSTVPERRRRMQDKFLSHSFRNPKGYTVDDNATHWHYNSETGRLVRQGT